MKPIPWPRFPAFLAEHGLGPFVVMGILGTITTVALMLVRRRRRDLGVREVASLVLVTAGAAAIGAHLVEVLLYRPERLGADGLRALLATFDGLASSGALVGGALGVVLAARRLRRDFGELADALAEVLPLGWALGRLGCFFVHDHPGLRLEGFPAVAYPGGPRLDLGLAEAVLLFVIGVSALASGRRSRAPGRITLGVLGAYALGRLLLDFARIDAAGARELAVHLPGAVADPRYLGLTPAQWLCLAFLGFLLLQRMRRKASPRFRAR